MSEQITSNDDSDRDAAAETGVGALLRASRQRVGEELRDVAAMLRIRYPYLEAIEAGCYGDLPGQTYAVGFVRAYAEHLGLDSEEVVRRFKAEIETGGKRHDLHFPTPMPETGIPGGAIVFVGLIVAVLAYGGWYLSTAEDGFLSDLVSPLPERLAALVSSDDKPSGSAPSDQSPASPADTSASEDGLAKSSTLTTSEAASAPAETPAAMQNEPLSPSDTETAAVAPTAPAEAAPPPAMAPKLEAGQETPAEALTSTSTPVQIPAQTQVKTPAEIARQAAEQTAAQATTEVTTEAATQTATQAATQAATPAPAETPAPQTATQPAETPPETASASVPESATPAASTVASASAPPPVADTAAETIISDAAASAAAVASATDSTAAEPTPAQPPESSAASRPSRISVRAIANSWIEVRDDFSNTMLVSRLLRQGEVYEVPDQSGLSLHTGNAGALVITVDGDAVPAIGAEGAVQRGVQLDPNLLKSGTAAR